jgi:ketosteroid isomerase-like protein
MQTDRYKTPLLLLNGMVGFGVGVLAYALLSGTSNLFWMLIVGSITTLFGIVAGNMTRKIRNLGNQRAATDAVVTALYTERLKNDITALRPVFHPNGVVQLVGEQTNPSIDRAAHHSANVHAFLQTLVDHWRWVERKEHSRVIEGTSACVRYTLTVEFIPTGERVETDLMDMITVKQGLITEFYEFVDTAMVERLASKVDG